MKKVFKVLVVDDNDDIRSVMVSFLDRDGYEVRSAANGTEALKAQEQTPFDVLITDIFMPDKDGVEIIHEFHHKYPHTSIIAMSAVPRTQVDYLSFSLEIVARKILRKPFSIAALYTALKEILAECEPRCETM